MSECAPKSDAALVLPIRYSPSNGWQASASTALKPIAIAFGAALAEYVIIKGEIGNALFVIDRGQCEVLGVERNGGRVIVGRGQSFGESALFTRAPRSADVRQSTNCDIHHARSADPFAAQVRSINFSELLILNRVDFEDVCIAYNDFMIAAWTQSPTMQLCTQPGCSRWGLVRGIVRLFGLMRAVGAVSNFRRVARMYKEVVSRQRLAQQKLVNDPILERHAASLKRRMTVTKSMERDHFSTLTEPGSPTHSHDVGADSMRHSRMVEARAKINKKTGHVASEDAEFEQSQWSLQSNLNSGRKSTIAVASDALALWSHQPFTPAAGNVRRDSSVSPSCSPARQAGASDSSPPRRHAAAPPASVASK